MIIQRSEEGEKLTRSLGFPMTQTRSKSHDLAGSVSYPFSTFEQEMIVSLDI